MLLNKCFIQWFWFNFTAQALFTMCIIIYLIIFSPKKLLWMISLSLIQGLFETPSFHLFSSSKKKIFILGVFSFALVVLLTWLPCWNVFTDVSERHRLNKNHLFQIFPTLQKKSLSFSLASYLICECLEWNSKMKTFDY